MKKTVSLVIVAIALFAAWRIHSKLEQSNREKAYRETMAPFQRDLHAGVTRAEVESYLDSKKVRYSGVFVGGDSAWSYETKIGEEPSESLFCESWIVYVAFEFSSSGNGVPEAKPLSGDTLKDIRIRKVGTCL